MRLYPIWHLVGLIAAATALPACSGGSSAAPGSLPVASPTASPTPTATPSPFVSFSSTTVSLPSRDLGGDASGMPHFYETSVTYTVSPASDAASLGSPTCVLYDTNPADADYGSPYEVNLSPIGLYGGPPATSPGNLYIIYLNVGIFPPTPPPGGLQNNCTVNAGVYDQHSNIVSNTVPVTIVLPGS